MICAAASLVHAQVPQLNDTFLRKQWVVATTERFAATHISTLSTDYDLYGERFAGRLRTMMISTTTLVGLSSTKDQIDAALDLEYRLPKAMRLFTITEGTLTTDAYRDAQIPGLNNTAAMFFGVGGRVVDSSGNRLGIAVGPAYNRQLNVEDAGGGIYGEAEGHLDLAGYRVDVESRARWFNISPRYNSNAYVEARVDRAFDEEGAAMFVQARYDLFGTGLYVKRSEEDVLQYGGLTYDGLQSREESRLYVNSRLDYPLGSELGLDVSLSVADQRIGQRELTEGVPPLPRDPDPFRYLRKGLSIGASTGLRWAPRDAYVNLRLEYSTSEEYNRVDPNVEGVVSDVELARKRASNAQNDYITQQVLLGGTAEYLLSSRDTLQANGSISIFRYDTPSPLNYFDKDEQSIQWQLRFARSFSPSLRFAVYGQMFLTHLVYLFGQNSNDNNWNRVFRLSPSVYYTLGESFSNFTEAEVLANYTEYDFEGRTQNIRGRSFRELRLRDSLEIALTGTLRLRAKGDLRIAERGSFSWSQFAESPLERTRTEGIEAEVVTGILRDVRFGVGGKLSRVKTFRTDPRTLLMEPFSDRTSFGPMARFEAQLSSETDVRLWGWWEHRFEDSRLVNRLPIVFLTVGMKL